MTATHQDVSDALNTIRAKAVRFEKNAHLGQPIRSHQMYSLAITTVEPTPPEGIVRENDRYSLADACSRALWASKHDTLDRDALIARIAEAVAELERQTELARASRL